MVHRGVVTSRKAITQPTPPPRSTGTEEPKRLKTWYAVTDASPPPSDASSEESEDDVPEPLARSESMRLGQDDTWYDLIDARGRPSISREASTVAAHAFDLVNRNESGAPDLADAELKVFVAELLDDAEGGQAEALGSSSRASAMHMGCYGGGDDE